VTGPTRRWLKSVRPQRRHLRADVLAGLPGAISSVPDGMAASVLAGVNPIYGLYAGFAGPAAGGLTSSTGLMVIGPTTAAALVAGSVLSGVDPADQEEFLFLLTVVAGLVMLAAGFLKLGRYVRFVSHSVMIGFLTGVAANIVLGQVPDLTGAPAEGEIALTKAINVLLHPGQIDTASLLVGSAALVLLVVLAATPLRQVRALVALVIPTALASWAGSDSVALVEDVGKVPRGLPLPHLPELSQLSPSLVTAALSIAIVVLVQGAGVAESAPNPDGSRSDANGDFKAQGIGNLASGLFRGLPVGGSVGNTALNVSAGARTRWAAIWSGVWMLAILAVFSGAVGKVAMPTLAAVLIYAGIGSIKPRQIRTIMRTGIDSRIAVIVTFVATLLLPIQVAVAIGVTVSLLLQLRTEAMDLKVVELLPQPDGSIREAPAPASLPSGVVTALDVYGSLLYAGARTLQVRLPDPGGATRPVVVLRLRGRTSLGSTFFVMTTDYAKRLEAVGGRLFLSGIDAGLLDVLNRTRTVGERSHVEVFEATDRVGQSTLTAYQAAEEWLTRRSTEGDDAPAENPPG
jgi:sulfate permease, SulP family